MTKWFDPKHFEQALRLAFRRGHRLWRFDFRKKVAGRHGVWYYVNFECPNITRGFTLEHIRVTDWAPNELLACFSHILKRKR
jgi:hypothetical protein